MQINRDGPKGKNKFPASGNVKSLLDGPGFICTFFTLQSGTFLSSMILFIAHLECNFLKCLDKRPSSRWGALREDTEQNEKVREEGTGGHSLYWRGVSMSLCYRIQLHCPGAAKVSEGRRGDVRLSSGESCSGAEARTSLCNQYMGIVSLWWNYCHQSLFLTGCVELHPCLKSC